MLINGYTYLSEKQEIAQLVAEGKVTIPVSEDGRTTEDYIKELLGVPENYKLEAMLSLGIPDEFPEGHKIEDLPMEKVHWEHF